MKRFLSCIVLITITLSGFSQKLTQAEKIMGLSLLWQEANYNFAFFDQVDDLDWDEEYKNALEEVTTTECDIEYYQILQKFIAKLDDGHTNVYYPEWIEEQMIYPSIDIHLQDGEYFITHRPRTLHKSIPLGSELVSINGQPVDEYLTTNIHPYIASSTQHAKERFALDQIFDGLADTEYNINIITPKGNQEEIQFQLTDKLQDSTKAIEQIYSEKRKDDLYYVSLSSFEDESVIQEFRDLIGEINESKGLVLDLRENVGGLGVVALNVAQYFLQQDELMTMSWKSRQHIASLKAWGNSGLQLVGYESVEDYKDFGDLDAWITVESDIMPLDPNRVKVNVPIVILTSERTASAAENFLIYTNQNPEIMTLGTTTFGSTGQPIYFNLPGGAIARICTKKNFDIDGSEFVGYGIQPDYYEPITLQDQLNGVDSQLEKALEMFD